MGLKPGIADGLEQGFWKIFHFWSLFFCEIKPENGLPGAPEFHSTFDFKIIFGLHIFNILIVANIFVTPMLGSLWRCSLF